MLLDLLGSTFAELTQKNVTQHYKRALSFFLVVFDYRTEHSNAPDTQLDAVEKESLSSFILLVLRLNESIFKPMFLKVVDWAIDSTQTTPQQQSTEKKTPQQKSLRSVMLYKLMDGLSSQLKSIFVPYYGYVLDDIISLISTPIPLGDSLHYKRTCLMLNALLKCFVYDSDQHWINKDKFDRLLPALVAVLENNSLPQYEELVQNYLSPTVSQLAVCLGTEVRKTNRKRVCFILIILIFIIF